jgi:hypothetical protein
MSSVWRRTAAEARWTSHHVVVEKKTEDSEAGSSITIPWPQNLWITAEVEEDSPGRWKWAVFTGPRARRHYGCVVEEGSCGTEETAKRKAIAVVKRLVAYRRKELTTTPELEQMLADGWTLHPNFVNQDGRAAVTTDAKET